MKDWSYSKLSKDASEHGGPEKYIKFIEESNMNAGIIKGRTQGSVSTLLILIPVIGKLIYDKYKQAKQNSLMAKQKLLDELDESAKKEQPEQ